MGNIVGVDPHRKSVTVAVLDERGGLAGTASFVARRVGFTQMLAWVTGFGPVDRWGVEGATGLGRDVSIFCEERGHDVREVPPVRISHARKRGQRGKSDRIDAESIARHTLAHPGLARPFKRSEAGGPDPVWELLQLLVGQRRSGTKSRRRWCNEADALLAGLPEDLRDRLGDNGAVRPRLRRLTTLGPGVLAGVDQVTVVRLELLTERTAQIRAADAADARIARRLKALVGQAGSTLTGLVGIADRTAADLLVEVGDPHRFASAAAFAMFNGTAPLAASSGEGDGPPRRHRLNRGGNRRMNAILHQIAITQIRCEPRAQELVAAAAARHLTPREARRVLKRRLSDVIYRQMIRDWDRAHPRPEHHDVAA